MNDLDQGEKAQRLLWLGAQAVIAVAVFFAVYAMVAGIAFVAIGNS